MGSACAKTLPGVLTCFLTSFVALLVCGGKCMCENSHWCVDVFFDVILALLVCGGKCMCENSHWCVDVFFDVIFGVAGLRWEVHVREL